MVDEISQFCDTMGEIDVYFSGCYMNAAHGKAQVMYQRYIDAAREAKRLMLKQEPVPTRTSNGIVHCGNCGKGLMWSEREPNPGWQYCAYCGKRVKWDD